MSRLNPGDLLSVKQALALVPLGRSTIYRLIEEGQIASIRVKCTGSRRGRILVRRIDLAAFIERSRVGDAS